MTTLGHAKLLYRIAFNISERNPGLRDEIETGVMNLMRAAAHSTGYNAETPDNTPIE